MGRREPRGGKTLMPSQPIEEIKGQRNCNGEALKKSNQLKRGRAAPARTESHRKGRGGNERRSMAAGTSAPRGESKVATATNNEDKDGAAWLQAEIRLKWRSKDGRHNLQG